MDPNEYDLLQGKLFASFGNIPNQYLLPATIIISLSWFFLFYKRHYLDVFHLGKEQAINLGIDTDHFQFLVLCCVSLLTGTATALVGPITFLGFIVANISYRFFATYRHGELFLGVFDFRPLFSGWAIARRTAFGWNTTVSIVVEFLGWRLFYYKIDS